MKCCREGVEGSVKMDIRQTAAVNGGCIELANFGIRSFDLWSSNARWFVKLGQEKTENREELKSMKLFIWVTNITHCVHI